MSKRKENNAWLAGFACAVAYVAKYDDRHLVAELLTENDITTEDLNNAGVDEGDLAVIVEVLAEAAR